MQQTKPKILLRKNQISKHKKQKTNAKPWQMGKG